MSHESGSGSHDPFNAKYLIIALAVALALPLMHVLIGINIFLK